MYSALIETVLLSEYDAKLTSSCMPLTKALAGKSAGIISERILFFPTVILLVQVLDEVAKHDIRTGQTTVNDKKVQSVGRAIY